MREEGGWAANRWELSAPESHALLYGPKAKPGQVLKLAVLELVARKALALVEVEEPGFFGTKKAAVLTDGPERGLSLGSRPLAAVLDLYGGIPRNSFPGGVTGARSTACSGSSPQRAGRSRPRARRRERSFGDWVDREPARALAFLGVAGSSVLLMDAIHPDLQRLREEEEATGYAGGVYTGDPDDTLQDDASPPDSFEPGTLDFGALDLDFGAFGDLGSAFDSIDAGVDAGGGGDSGGGGGDGGGGGNGGGGS